MRMYDPRGSYSDAVVAYTSTYVFVPGVCERERCGGSRFSRPGGHTVPVMKGQDAAPAQ